MKFPSDLPLRIRGDVARLLELREQVSVEYRPLLTRAAQALAAEPVDEGCKSCAGFIDQLPRGRPRRYCTVCSPRKKTEKGKVAA